MMKQYNGKNKIILISYSYNISIELNPESNIWEKEGNLLEKLMRYDEAIKLLKINIFLFDFNNSYDKAI